MMLLLQNGLNPARSTAFFNHVQAQLQSNGVAVDVVDQTDLATQPLERYELVVSNLVIPQPCRLRAPCYGAVQTDRSCGLRLLARCGLPVMPWALARTPHQVRSLFDLWAAERLLLKRSGSFGGTGVTAFTRAGLDQLTWDPDRDLFCPELNPASGDVYKAEVFGGEVVMSFRSASPPLHASMTGPVQHGVPGIYGTRTLLTFPEPLLTDLHRLASELHRLGAGHCSIDFMQDSRGDFQAIEINGGFVALWWTQQHDIFCHRMGGILERMVRECGRTARAAA